MKAILLAITAALAVVAGVTYFNEEAAAPTRLLTVDPVESAWTAWKRTYGRAYGSASDESYRLSVFRENYNYVNSINSTQKDFTVALNQFADMSNQEFKKQMAGLKQQRTTQNRVRVMSTANLPDSVDWRTNGAVTPVKNQGSCGSCWAFSTTGSMESRYQIKNGSLPNLSEQQLVDCSSAQGNQGCNGGLMDQGFTYAEQTGLESESDYPYTGRDGTCKQVSGGVKVSSFADVTANSPSQLKAAVAEGPVSIALDGAGLAFQFYFGGIIKSMCGTSLDHGVLAVGYGSENGTDYWIVKNSWGASWGESGYVRIKNNNTEGDKGICGLNQQPSYPIY